MHKKQNVCWISLFSVWNFIVSGIHRFDYHCWLKNESYTTCNFFFHKERNQITERNKIKNRVLYPIVYVYCLCVFNVWLSRNEKGASLCAGEGRLSPGVLWSGLRMPRIDQSDSRDSIMEVVSKPRPLSSPPPHPSDSIDFFTGSLFSRLYLIHSVLKTKYFGPCFFFLFFIL